MTPPLSPAEVRRLAKKYSSPAVESDAYHQQRREATRICQRRLRAEIRGRDTSMFPKRVRGSKFAGLAEQVKQLTAERDALRIEDALLREEITKLLKKLSKYADGLASLE